MAVQLRQSPVDSCLLEYSIDGGENWEPVFDFSKCSPRSARVAQLKVVMDGVHKAQTTIMNNRTVYQGDILNVAPGWDFSRGDLPLRGRALCYALFLCVGLVVDSLAGIRKSEHEQEDTGLNVFSDLYGSFSGLTFGGIAIGLTAAWLPWAAMSFAILTVTVNLVRLANQVDLSLFENKAIQQTLACCTYEAMKGQTPSYSRFSTALDNCSLSGDAEKLRLLVRPFFKDEDLFMQLFMLGEPVIAAQKRGAQVPCDCIEWCYQFDFTTSDGGWTTRADDNRDFGAWVSGSGWRSVWGRADDIDDERLHIKREFPSLPIKRVTLTFRASAASGRQGVLALVLRRGGKSVASKTITRYAAGELVLATGDIDVEADTLALSVTGDVGSDSAIQIDLVSAEFRGTRLNPFGADNCPERTRLGSAQALDTVKQA